MPQQILNTVLRRYQDEAVNSIIRGFDVPGAFLKDDIPAEDKKELYRKQLVIWPTGAGKTLLYCALTTYYHAEGKRVLILVDQTDLVDQTRDEILKQIEINPQIEQGDRTALPTAKVVIGTVQSMARRLHRYPPDHFDIVIADEADRSVADQWQTVLNYFDGHAKVLGATATPDRNDQRSVMGYYDRIADEKDMFDLIKEGYLSRVMVQTIPLKIDISKVKQSQGDYDANELDTTLTPYFDEICEAIKQYAPDRKILAFLPLIKTSEFFVEVAIKHGIKAAHIDGQHDSDERSLIKAAFRNRNIQLLSNAVLLGRGYNDPSIDCILNLRPTRSAPLYRQFIGRGTRTFCPHGHVERCECEEAKDYLLLLDFLYQFERHGLIRPANLIARDKKQADDMTAFSESKAGEMFDLETIDTAVAEEAAKKLAEMLEKQKPKKPGYFDAMDFAVTMQQRWLIDYIPRKRWESESVTEKQAAYLERKGIDVDTLKNRGHASAVINQIWKRQEAGLATAKQVKQLQKYGVQSPDTVSFKNAGIFLGAKFDKKPLPDGFDLYAKQGETA